MVSKKSSLNETNVEKKKKAQEVKSSTDLNSKKKKEIKTDSNVKTVKSKVVKAVSVKKETVTDHNYNPVDEVLTIKAKNDEKREISASKKAEKTKSKLKTPSNDVENIVTKQSKVVSSTNKRDEVKENAKKAGEKKFKALKEERYNNECKSTSAFRAFIDGYKNIFKYNARTSRYEYWAFLLLNAIFGYLCSFVIALSSAFISPAFAITFTVIFNLVQILVYLSLVVRRIHDIGEKAWKDFYAPLTYSAVAILFLAFGVNYLSQVVPTNSIGLILIVLLLLVALLINVYYLVKIFVVASFIEEEKKENIYGLQKAYDLNKTIRFMCLYFIITVVSFTISNAIVLNNMLGIKY